MRDVGSTFHEAREQRSNMSNPRARMMAVRRQIVRSFKKHQLTLQVDATEYLEATLEAQNVPDEDLGDTLDNIATGYVAREGLSIVNKARLETVLESMQKWTHHLHEKPTRNTLDPHRSQHSLHQSQQSRHRSEFPDPETDIMKLDSMRERINEMEARDSQEPTSGYPNYMDEDDLLNAGDRGYSQDGMRNEPEEEEDDVDITELFHVVDAFQMPRWSWATDVKTFVRVDPVQKQKLLAQESQLHQHYPPNHPHSQAGQMTNQVLAIAEEKTTMYRERYHVLLQRIMRNESFAPPVFTGGADQDKYLKLTPLKALKGRSGEMFLMYGMMVQTSDGKYSLEDADEQVALDLRNCKRSAGFFTENSFVLVEGIYTDDNIIFVENIALPPSELRSESRKLFGNMDFLGAPRELRSEEQLKVISEEYEDICFVILSDVFLDQPKTLSTLRTIFEGYAQSTIPLAFILCGSFKSQPFLLNGQESGPYREGFNALAELIAEFPTLATFSYFVFVPGPNDPWVGRVLPRPKIPDFYTGKLRSVVKRSIFTSNPCRIKYCDQEIVIFREDILNKLLRNCVLPPVDDVVIQKQLVRTIIDEAHLCPLPLTTRQVSWAYDHALRIYPVPDALILADKFEAYNFKYQNCHCMNPGSFPTSDYSWMVYYPGSRRSDICQLPKSTR